MFCRSEPLSESVTAESKNKVISVKTKDDSNRPISVTNEKNGKVVVAKQSQKVRSLIIQNILFQNDYIRYYSIRVSKLTLTFRPKISENSFSR